MVQTPLAQAEAVVSWLLSEHPVLPSFRDQIAVVLTGSLGAGFADELSDIDLLILCPDAIVPDISHRFQEAGLRFGVPSPHMVTGDGLKAHYFTVLASKLRERLEAHEDDALFLVKHSVALHDPQALCSDLSRRFAQVPAAVVREKVTWNYSLVSQRSVVLGEVMRRYQPLKWLEVTELLLRSALLLCCWLDGEAPTVQNKWLMHQARSRATAPVILPAVHGVLQAIGPALQPQTAFAGGSNPLLDAAKGLDAAAREAVECAGFGSVPRWTPDQRFW
jgi:hypothetical protein